MTSPQLLAKTADLCFVLENQVKNILLEKHDSLREAQMVLMITDDAIRTLKSWTLSHDFDCWENEITMFKILKPKLISTFIFYSKVVTFLSSLPHAGFKLSRKIYDMEFEALQYFSLENKDFISYYRRNATYLDLKYFIRFKYDLDVKLTLDIHSYDDRFSTSHDHLVSQIIAYDRYEAFLKNHFQNLKIKAYPDEIPHCKLTWTAPKVALTELIFSLHQTNCFNGGNSSLNETIRYFEKIFTIDLGNPHKTILEIRTRKNYKTKFIQLLADNLNTYLDALDE